MAAQRKRRETFGAIRKLPSGRYQASHLGPENDVNEKGHRRRYTAPMTFDTQTDARAWLSRKRIEIADKKWRSPVSAAPAMFGPYARAHVDTRTNSRGEPLKPRTRDEYLRLVAGPLAPFEHKPLSAIRPDDVRRWYSEQAKSGKQTQAGHAYRLLKSVMATAVGDGLIDDNPCQIKGASKASTGRDVKPPTDAELAIIIASIDRRLSLLIEVAAWSGLRWGELTELRRGDVLISGETVTLAVSRAVTYTKSDGFVIGKPKSFAGNRTVALPHTLTTPIRAHLSSLNASDDALVFPALSDASKHLSAGSFAQFWRPARAAAGREDMPFHALRHFGATRYAMAGATTKELMRRMGHNDMSVAMRYQHEAGRDEELARRMSDLAGGA
ncbi:tyrosine-type recombinase/integrase [Microbacterium sp. E-13]|uniref:tyrosine-type recombinase/integrase n=1 Tax=Microbacterium sp. E-13 TaxID=3404048 RepID=UPI003CE777E3